MFITGHDIEIWGVGVLGSTCANILTFLFFTSITSTHWFKFILAKLTQDLDDINILKQKMKEKN